MDVNLCLYTGLAVATVLVIAFVAAACRSRETFYTRYSREEPTRSDTPYTGTIPYGPWGTKPWSEVIASGGAMCGAYSALHPNFSEVPRFRH
jgi:hypothetical protein